MDALPQAVFVDTSAWIALIHARDQAHSAAARIWKRLKRSGRPVVTTDLVVAEAHTLLARRADPALAADFVRRLLARPDRLLWNDALTAERALDWLEKFADRPLSLTDAVSFATMDLRRIRDAFTFDRDFEDAGFAVFGGTSPSPER